MGLLRKIARYALRQTATTARRTAKRALHKVGTRLFSSSAKPKRATTSRRTTRKRATARKKVRR
jgi:hypothetical protein